MLSCRGTTSLGGGSRAWEASEWLPSSTWCGLTLLLEEWSLLAHDYWVTQKALMGKRRCDISCVNFADGNTHEMESKVFNTKELVYIEKLQFKKRPTNTIFLSRP